ncbi:MAG: ribonuclease P protein component [Chitinispirillaceae bacterium]|nr:ribonuclease P protein component [Chitinispirillaceae bacterium]
MSISKKRDIIVAFKTKKLNAVKRNKIKRRVREIIRKNFKYIGERKRIIITDDNIIKKKYKELEEYIKNYINKK